MKYLSRWPWDAVNLSHWTQRWNIHKGRILSCTIGHEQTSEGWINHYETNKTPTVRHRSLSHAFHIFYHLFFWKLQWLIVFLFRYSLMAKKGIIYHQTIFQCQIFNSREWIVIFIFLQWLSNFWTESLKFMNCNVF